MKEHRPAYLQARQMIQRRRRQQNLATAIQIHAATAGVVPKGHGVHAELGFEHVVVAELEQVEHAALTLRVQLRLTQRPARNTNAANTSTLEAKN